MNFSKLHKILKENDKIISGQGETLELEIHCAEEGYQLNVSYIRYDAVHNKIIIGTSEEQ